MPFGCPRTRPRLSTLPLTIPKCKTYNGKSMGTGGTPVSIHTLKRLICGIPRLVTQYTKLYLLFLCLLFKLDYCVHGVFVHYLDRAYHNVKINEALQRIQKVYSCTPLLYITAVSLHFYGVLLHCGSYITSLAE